jgi:hypothetical protein
MLLDRWDLPAADFEPIVQVCLELKDAGGLDPVRPVLLPLSVTSRV